MNLHSVRGSKLTLQALSLCLVLSLFSMNAKGQDAARAPDVKRPSKDEKSIRALIVQLADESFDKREAAAKGLMAIGGPALALLEKSAQEAGDPELRDQAARLVAAISKGQFAQFRRFDGHKSGTQSWVTRVVITPDGKRAVSVSNDGLRCWDLAGGKQVVFFDEKNGAQCWGLAISADGKRVIAGCAGGQAHVFDLGTGKRIATLIGHSGSVWGVALSGDGRQAITGGGDRTIRVWDVASGKQTRAFEGVADEVRCLDLAPNGKFIVTGHFAGNNQPGAVRIWDFHTARVIKTMAGHSEAITSVAFSPDGKSVLSASWDHTARLWDVATGKEIRVLNGHTNRVEYAAFADHGKWVIACGNLYSPSLRIWNAATGNQILESEGVPEGFFGVAASPDGRQFVSGGRDGVVRLWQWKR